MKAVPFQIHAMLPCDCGRCNSIWFYGDDETMANPMWPKTCVPGETVVFHCWHCGRDVEKKVDSIRCDIPTDFGAISYTLDSSGLFSWLCPAHGRRELTVSAMPVDPDVYRSAAQNSIGLCCADSMTRQKKQAEGVKTEIISKCIACNHTIPERELVFFPHVDKNGCEVGKLPICRSCWYDHEDFFTLEDECSACDQCEDGTYISPADYDDTDGETFCRLAVQNIEVDSDNVYTGFELVCKKSGAVLARVESTCEDDEDDLDF